MTASGASHTCCADGRFFTSRTFFDPPARSLLCGPLAHALMRRARHMRTFFWPTGFLVLPLGHYLQADGLGSCVQRGGAVRTLLLQPPAGASSLVGCPMMFWGCARVFFLPLLFDRRGGLETGLLEALRPPERGCKEGTKSIECRAAELTPSCMCVRVPNHHSGVSAASSDIWSSCSPAVGGAKGE